MTAHYYTDDIPPDWWASIDTDAALAERWPDPNVLRRTERPQLGMLVDPEARIAERVERGARTQERDADLFIARMEERTGIGRAYRERLTELATARAVKRREEWAARMREKGIAVKEPTDQGSAGVPA